MIKSSLFDENLIQSAMDNDTRENILVPQKNEYDESENVLRPKSMDGYVGQDKVKENLRIFITASKMRQEALDHVSNTYCALCMSKV